MLDRFPYSSAEFKRVRGIQFGILSPEELVRGCDTSEGASGGWTPLESAS